MKASLPFPKNKTLSLRLRLFNLAVGLTFLLVFVVILFAFRSVNEDLGKVVRHDVGQAVRTARLARDLASAFADLNLFLHTFQGRDDYLATEGDSLIMRVRDAVSRAEEGPLAKELVSFPGLLTGIIDQCRKVNRHHAALYTTERQIFTLLDQLDATIADELIGQTLAGNDTLYMEQLAALVAGYRQSMLEMGKTFAELPFDHFTAADAPDKSPLLPAYDDLLMRLKTITASVEPVARGGQMLIALVEQQKRNMQAYYRAMADLGALVAQFNEAKQILTSRLAALDRELLLAAGTAERNIRKIHLYTSLTLLTLLTITLLVLKVAIASFIRHNLRTPLEKIEKGIASLSSGNLETRIDLGRTDEWLVIEEALNRMAAELAESYTKINQQKHLLDTVISNIPGMICLKDGEGRWLLANDYHLRLFELEHVDYQGKTDAELARYSEFYRDAFLSCMETDEMAWAKGEPSRADEVIPRPDGTKRIFDIVKVPLFHEDGRRHALVVIGIDVTDRYRAEEEQLKVKKLESIGVLAGGIAHDFNNILAAVMGNISLAMRLAETDAKLHDLLVAAEKGALRAGDLVRQLLTFAKGGEPVKQLASIAEVIKESADFVLRGSNVRCEYHFAADIWPVEIDTSQISQVIQNIVINADQAMPEGGTIDIYCENLDLDSPLPPQLVAGRYIKITIQDQGVGIADEIRDKIFDPYFSTKQKGSGLGLAITHSIVTRHGGAITVDAAPTGGAVFSIYLPARPSAGCNGPAASSPADARPIDTGQGGRILIMDDEEMVRNMLQQMLAHLGYSVVQAEDGRQAIDLFRQAHAENRPFAAVIMDLTIPGGMGGKEAVRALLEIDPDAKVIVSSGYSTDPIMANYRRYGFCAALDKPYRFGELASVLAGISRV